jgi:predicted nucleotide-binding protein
MAKTRQNHEPITPASVNAETGKRMLTNLSESGSRLLKTDPVSKVGFQTWVNLSSDTITKIFGSSSDYLDQFSRAGWRLNVAYGHPSESFYDRLRKEELEAKLATIDSFIEVLKFNLANEPSSAPALSAPTGASTPTLPMSREVFVVHGHDEATKTKVARFLERLELVPIILHERADQGQTIIEKLERNAVGASFAVVLMTPDDIGNAAKSPDKAQPRARQNVLLEMGYFIAKLGRSKVCALYASGVELPSDLFGVAYTPLDDHGAWETKLARELKASGLKIDMNNL